jgi:signal transduction histidine kinase
VLNESIRDLRNFIDGLEPEALKQQTFSQAVGDLIHAMSGMQPFEATIELDDQLAARLTLQQQVHALQIAREAISNALRHGQANRIDVILRNCSGLAEFKIIDNGSGFDALSASSHGRGLLNFVHRARELGATLAVESHPGRGTIVTLTLPIP